MKTAKYILTGVVAAFTAFSCSDLSKIENRINDLSSRVTALEKQIANLNNNVEGLQTLAGGGTIKEIKTSEGADGITYTITTSNGTVITLKQGSVGVGNPPVMSIDKDGYWMADYGQGPQYVMNGDQKVYAVGQDGITPKFSIDSEDYWTVSYDGGATFTRVLDCNGQPVKAIGGTEASDSYFKDVKVSDDMLELTLKNGDKYVVPVIKDFYFIITATDTSFDYGATKSYDVEMKGVSKTMITVPDGWKATLSENRLKVTAPANPETKATLADSRCDVTVLALNASGYACISKVSVSLTGVIITNAPTATIKPLESASNAVYFKIYADDATEWYYLIQPASEEAPTNSQIISDGKKETEISKTVSATGLNEQTLYDCYVLPINGEEKGTIAKASSKTAAVADQYGSYMAGKNVVIGGKVYNKAEYGDAIHVTEALALGTNCKGIYFVDPGVEVSVSTSAKPDGDLVITSYNPASRGKFLFQADQIKPSKAGINIILNNLDVDIKKNNLLYYTNGVVERFGFYNCAISLSVANFNITGGALIKNIDIIDCDFKTSQIIRLIPGDKEYKIESVNISGNVFYSTTGSNLLFKFFSTGTSSVKTSVGSVTMENNLFYNLYNDRGMIGPVSLEKIYFRNNIFCYSAVCSQYQRIVYLSWDGDSLTSLTPDQYATYPSSGEVCANAVWNAPRLTNVVYKASDRLKDKSWSYEEKIDLPSNPLETEDVSTGTFKLKQEYRLYGPQR